MMKHDNSFDHDRIHEIARRAGALRSLYLGEAIGSALATAWQALAAGAMRVRRAAADAIVRSA